MTQSGFNINTFKSNTEAKKYFQKNSKFLLRIPCPEGLFYKDHDLYNTSRVLEMWCNSSAIPGVALATHDGMRYTYGAREKRPFAPIFQDIPISVIADGQGDNYNFLTSWIRLINNFNGDNGIDSGTNYGMSTYEISYRHEYISSVEIVLYREDGREIYRVTLRDAFPLMVGDQRVNWQDHAITHIPIILTFTDWYITRNIPTNVVQSVP